MVRLAGGGATLTAVNIRVRGSFWPALERSDRRQTCSQQLDIARQAAALRSEISGVPPDILWPFTLMESAFSAALIAGNGRRWSHLRVSDETAVSWWCGGLLALGRHYPRVSARKSHVSPVPLTAVNIGDAGSSRPTL